MEKKLEFNNIPNKRVKTEDGNEIWISRSVAVDGVVMMRDSEGELYVLILQRSSKMEDQPNKWCLPCGYLDWNESGYGAIIREIYEETGIDIKDKSGFIINEDYKREFYVSSDPLNNRQNVSLYYLFVFDFDGIIPKGWDVFYPNDEVSRAEWIKVEHVFRNMVQIDGRDIKWAFNHDEKIKLAYYHFHNE